MIFVYNDVENQHLLLKLYLVYLKFTSRQVSFLDQKERTFIVIVTYAPKHINKNTEKKFLNIIYFLLHARSNVKHSQIKIFLNKRTLHYK